MNQLQSDSRFARNRNQQTDQMYGAGAAQSGALGDEMKRQWDLNNMRERDPQGYNRLVARSSPASGFGDRGTGMVPFQHLPNPFARKGITPPGARRGGSGGGGGAGSSLASTFGQGGGVSAHRSTSNAPGVYKNSNPFS